MLRRKKQYDSTKKVSQEDVDKIVEAARLAPTSSGLQQFRVLVVSNRNSSRN
jgi:nitroreductase